MILKEKAKAILKIIDVARGEGRKFLLEPECNEVLKLAGIPVAETKVAKGRTEVAEIAKEIGYPIVLKVLSPQILHKSDVKGVKLDIRDDKELFKAYDEIMANVKKLCPGARVSGVLVQRYYPRGREVIVGATVDPQFGPTIMFGLGGVFVEVYNDVAFRVLPITDLDIDEMIKEIKGYKVLKGFRGEKPVNFESLKKIISRASSLILESNDIKEMDLNPIKLYSNDAIVVDARIILK